MISLSSPNPHFHRQTKNSINSHLFADLCGAKLQERNRGKFRRGSLEVKLPTIWTMGKQRWESERRSEAVRRSERRKTFRSQNAQNTPKSSHFWKCKCRKSAGRCGAKHMSKSERTKHTIHGTRLEVEMSRKCTLLWGEAHFQVKMLKAPHTRTTTGHSDVEKVHAVVAQSTCRTQKCKELRGSDHFWTFKCRFARQAQGIVHLVKNERKWGVL